MPGDRITPGPPAPTTRAEADQRIRQLRGQFERARTSREKRLAWARIERVMELRERM